MTDIIYIGVQWQAITQVAELDHPIHFVSSYSQYIQLGTNSNTVPTEIIVSIHTQCLDSTFASENSLCEKMIIAWNIDENVDEKREKKVNSEVFRRTLTRHI